MSRAGDPYRSSAGDLRGGGRWDAERFAMERDRARFEERESYLKPGGRARERSVDEIYERRGPRGFEEERFESRRYYDDDEPRIPRRERERDVTIEKERYYSPSPPRRAPPVRPGFLRRQSSLDTFDRKPLNRFVEREEYGPPARYREEAPRPVPLTPIPLPRSRALPPPRRYAEKEYYDEIEIAEDFYADDGYRGYPVREREREIIRKKKRRSRSRDSRMSRSVKSSVRSSSSSSSSSETTAVSVRSEFPKKGKTRMPARLVSKRAIIDLGYPFEEEGDIIIIQRALGRENIDEVIKLSEDYKANERVIIDERRSEHGGSGTVVEERHEVFTIPPPPPPAPIVVNAPAPVEVVKETKVVEFENPHHHHHHHHNSGGAIILDAGPREESTFVRREHDSYVERSDPIPVGPLALALAPERSHARDERAIRAEIKALEAEKEALRAEKRADKELRKADRLRREGNGEMVVYERDRVDLRSGEEVTLVRRERIEDDGGVRIEKDKKGPPPALIRAMLKTLT